MLTDGEGYERECRGDGGGREGEVAWIRIEERGRGNWVGG